jgi:hypothetical protein
LSPLFIVFPFAFFGTLYLKVFGCFFAFDGFFGMKNPLKNFPALLVQPPVFLCKSQLPVQSPTPGPRRGPPHGGELRQAAD